MPIPNDSQMLRLQALGDKLIDLAIHEADPQHWPGAAVSARQLDKDDREHLKWCKTNASATVSLALKLRDLATGQNREGRDLRAHEMEREINRITQQASDVIASVINRSRAPSG